MDALAERAIVGNGTAESAWLEWIDAASLPSVTAAELVPAQCRVVVVAPHPDDEILSVGGLLVQLARLGRAIDIVAVTDGTGSHEGSTDWTSDRLKTTRPQETRRALARLGLDIEPLRLELLDGDVSACESELAQSLGRHLRSDDVVFTTFRDDGHPDHEATARACALAAGMTGARLVEIPVWAWHWAAPGDPRFPWHRARRIELDAAAAACKQSAVRAFESQLLPDASTGAGPILRPSTVERTFRPFEIVFT
ncbi:PIG-L family deacetylase [soil metagenome]